ncbi:dTMP kinase [Paralimibaculum aggregatum]|uniref:Thymidylate kinase n=1 Tax=Paralimibaculum aggregatum TaxID=3036245 RepID=A0ABQ6LI25_9RHOB|nr:dTMP kinase [Limibaculum sp. NKW23]GMG81789.1 dTMP kinase [Limibaculum sp. NKW23]
MAPAPRGLFVTLEGIDGSGKSTQARRLAAALEAEGRAVTLTREPGGAPGAEEIRRLLVTGAPGRWSAETEILLFTAARRDHLERRLAPALAAGHIVICDRYVDSTRAYQGGDPARRALVDALHREAIGLDPDLTLLCDIAPEAAAARAAARAEGAGEDRFERKGLALQRALRARFLAMAEAEPARFRVVDAAAPEETVARRLRDALAPALDAAAPLR